MDLATTTSTIDLLFFIKIIGKIKNEILFSIIVGINKIIAKWHHHLSRHRLSPKKKAKPGQIIYTTMYFASNLAASQIRSGCMWLHVVVKYTDEKVLTIEFDINVSDARCSFGQFLGEMMGDLKVVDARGEWSDESKNNLMSYEFNRVGKMKNMVTFQLPDRNIVLELKKKCEFKYAHQLNWICK